MDASSILDDGRPEGGQDRRLRMPHAAADVDVAGRQVEIAAGPMAFGCADGAVPAVVLLDPREARRRRSSCTAIVLGEARVAVDPERRPRRICLERDALRRKSGGERLDQGDQRLLEEPFELRLAGLEPGAVVVCRQVGQELDGLRSETGECAAHGSSCHIAVMAPMVATAASRAPDRASTMVSSSASVTTNGGPSRIWSPSMPSALPVPE